MKKRFRRGTALVSAMVVLTVVTFLGSSLMTLALGGLGRSREDMLRAQALDAAEAGVEQAINFLRNGSPDGNTDGTWRTAGYTEELAAGRGYEFTVDDGEGDNAGRIVIDSQGEATLGARTQKRRLVAVVTHMIEDISVWDNVIFGGVGQSGKSINGNVVMRGKVHLLGDGEPYTDIDNDGKWDNAEPFEDQNGNKTWDPGEPYTDSDNDGRYDHQEPFTDLNGNGVCDPPLTVTDLATEVNGTANIGNNYSGMSSTLRALLPSLPTQSFMGETVESLSAKLRVKHGRVDISGTATIGEPHAEGGTPAIKETMNGVYVSDGFGGNKGSSQVYSDNGTSHRYELGDWVKFPDLISPTEIDGVQYNSHMDYLAEQGLTITGPITLKPNETFGPYSDGKGNRIYIDGATKTMEITGIVRVTGDIHLSRGSGSGNDTFRYTGKGTLASTESVHVHTNVLPASGFPAPDSLGLLARRRIELATGSGDSQLTMAGAFYAQEKVVSAKQNKIAGTFVSSYFEMNQVPHMYQVPKLAERDSQGRYLYLPPGMPGGEPKMIVSMEINGSRERKPR